MKMRRTGLSVYVVQKLTSKRRGIDYLSKLLTKVLDEIQAGDLFAQDTEDAHRIAAMKQRYIANLLLYIKDAVPTFCEGDIQYISEKFDGMRDYYGDHADADKMDPLYERERTNIMIKAAKVQLKIYGFPIKERQGRE